VVLKGLLAKAEADQLRDEAEAALSGAYGSAIWDESSELADVPAYVVPTMNAMTPLSADLVADDARFWQASHYLLGNPTIPTNSEAVCYCANARWHSDMAPEVQGVKFMVYLDESRHRSGQLQVLPGSHRGSSWAAFTRHLAQDPERQGFPGEWWDWPVPSYEVEVDPGDVIAFHSNLLHASSGGKNRLAWDTSYFAHPACSNLEQDEIVRDGILYTGDYSQHAYDHEEWTTWRDWVRVAVTDQRRTAVRRLERIGVLDVEGADTGVPRWQPRLANSVPFFSGAPYKYRENQASASVTRTA